MKSLLPIFLLFVFTTNSFAQINLVKNPGFEDYRYCPGVLSLVSDAYYWSALVDTSFYLDSMYINAGSMGTISTWNANCVPYYLNACDT